MLNLLPLKVLMLEDQALDAELILDELRQAGFEPECLRVETRAEYLAELDPSLDLILDDFNLPQFDGLTALMLLQERSWDIPFILISGMIGEELAVTAMKHGAADYLLKDRLSRLGQAVAHALEARRLRNERRTALEELRRLKEFNENVVQTTPEAIVILDSNGVITFANPAAAAIIGLTGQAAIGLDLANIQQFIPPDQHIIFAERLMQTDVNRFELDIVSHAGQRLTVIVSSSPRFDDGRFVGSLVILTDISERKRAEIEIRKLHSAVEQSGSSVIITDLQGNIEYVNHKFITLTGYTAAEVLGKNPRILQSSETAPQVYKVLWDTIIAGGTWHGELHNRKKNGELFWELATISPVKDAKGHITHFLAVKDDISERKRREAELSLKSNVLDAVSNSIVIMNFDGRIEWVNPAFTEMTGYSAEESKGYTQRELLESGQHEQAFYTELWDTVVSGQVWQGECINRRKDGSVYTEEQTVTPVLDFDGKIGHFVAIKRDISERKAFQIAQALDLKALKEMRLFLETTLDAFPANTVVLNSDGSIINVNAMWTHFAIQNAARAGTYSLGTNYLTVCDAAQEADSEEAPFVAAGIRAVIGGERDDFYLEYPCNSPRQARWFMLRVTPFPEPAPKRVVVAHINITERKLAEKFEHEQRLVAEVLALENAQLVDQLEERVQERTNELQASKEQVEAILNSSPDAILLVHPDLSVQQTNKSFNDLWVCQQDAYFGQSLLTLIHTEDADVVRQVVKLALNEQSVKPIEIRARRKGGTVFDAEMHVGFIEGDGLVCITRDITERKQAEESLRKSSAEIRDLYNNAPCGYHSIDKDGMIIQVNDTELHWLGYTRDEVINKLKITDIFTSESVLNFQKQFPLFKERGWVNDLEFDCILKDGSIMHILLNGTAIYDETGQYLQSRSTLFDITDLRKAQHAIIENEKRYRLLAENISDVIAKTNADGIRTFITPSCYALSGYTPDELLGQPSIDIVHPDDRSDTLATVMKAVSAGKTSFSFIQRLRHKGGHDVWVEVTSNLIYDPDTGKPVEIIGVIRDITERKQQELQLRYHASLQENVSDAVIVTDLDFCIQSWNKAAERIYGWSAEEVINKATAEILHTEYPSNSDQAGAIKHLREQGWWQGEIIQHHKDGNIVHILGSVTLIKDENGMPFAVVSVNHDITERREAEIVLHESEARFRLLVETAPVAIVITNQRGHISLVNDQAQSIFGYERAEILGQPVEILLPDHLHERHIQHRTAYLAAPTIRPMSSGLELQARRKDNTLFPVEIELSYIKTRNDILVMSFIVDITKRKEAEVALLQALAKEKELGDLKTRFVSMASHEFRTPLSTILALTETLSAYRHKLSDEQIDLRFDKIKGQVSHLKDIMEDVLLLARMQVRRAEFNPVLVDLDVLCRSVLDEFQSGVDMRHQLDYVCAAGVHALNLDRKLMRQIINNLVSNAIKYSPVHKSVCIKLETDKDALVLTVRDEGIGIPELDLQRLFEPFHRADNVGAISGTGLGLVITKEAVELHGGTIVVASAVDMGTTFTVRIPIA
jgi:PAS domain S-box-containing protein